MNTTLALVVAGTVAVVTRTGLHLLPVSSTDTAIAPSDPVAFRLVTGLAFFIVLIALGRGAVKNDNTSDIGRTVTDAQPTAGGAPEAT